MKVRTGHIHQTNMYKCHTTFSRRSMFRSLAAGSIMLPGILQAILAEEALGTTVSADPLAPKMPPILGRAKRVIFLYMSGGTSHLDTFDPKPRLDADAGKLSSDKPGAKPFLHTGWSFSAGGKCGTQVSDLFPRVRECMD